ncbi:autotransporter outer membrane beta-barrel domain-containing protein [Methylobacterium nonmethylotrophicum]|uniref:Autotransporter domain-containing protein n=1 Tax=Methylobacterium nonmethylotrophicum TaxID=1141884 RepID=A0A4Z0NR74_9HYPH|nr:autotransporter outer membrane beta-barrel domain-containing protein [Methylobacterium nonmethylotrophicum]TGD98930.1 autotransporter domain-containing protein [Methylobacterium nonmethylotrophicum]
MIRRTNTRLGWPLIGTTALLLSQALPAAAQQAFCPTVVAGVAGTPNQAGFNLDNGACTNGTIGAFSGAALGSQALSNLSQTSTQETSRATTDAIGARRNAEAQRDRSPPAREREAGRDQAPARQPAERRTDREAQPQRRAERDRAEPRERPAQRRTRAEAAPARDQEAPPRAAGRRAEPAEQPARRRARTEAAPPRDREVPPPREAGRRPAGARAEAPRAVAREEPGARPGRIVAPARDEPVGAEPAPRPYRVVKGYDAPLPVEFVPLPEGPRFSAWAFGFGDYEERSGRGQNNINCCTNAAPGGFPTPLAISIESRTTTAGFIGGLDMTVRDVGRAGDGVILGLLTGYTSASIDITSRAVSSNTGQVPNGGGSLRANLAGPSVGAFATYFDGPFSTDLTVKADIYALDERFVDQLGFSANIIGGVLRPPSVVTFAGSAATGLINTSVIANANYRFPIGTDLWLEPTAGIRYTASVYDRNALALGLDDGHLLRVQGGLRVGTDLLLGRDTRLTTSFTALAYSDVIVTGGFLPGAGFIAADILARSDEGKVRGQGILAANLDFGNGVSTFLQGEVRGGENLFGVGGKGGVRVRW